MNINLRILNYLQTESSNNLLRKYVMAKLYLVWGSKRPNIRKSININNYIDSSEANNHTWVSSDMYSNIQDQRETNEFICISNHNISA